MQKSHIMDFEEYEMRFTSDFSNRIGLLKVLQHWYTTEPINQFKFHIRRAREKRKTAPRAAKGNNNNNNNNSNGKNGNGGSSGGHGGGSNNNN